ncbi:hypothetical protein R1flu_021205 [Riccia fluitans]|uniref:Uncharacterized protein n=1 Tax=Riccia fluitans TaxID=41844 RepID=A0ABD1ZPU9_9MARC
MGGCDKSSGGEGNEIKAVREEVLSGKEVEVVLRTELLFMERDAAPADAEPLTIENCAKPVFFESLSSTHETRLQTEN